ncbi:peptidoglycan recognition protein family protein [Streptomyces chumphonensis]|uniref:peptidoglycan recognition protein family protein n=1 Tax=Streptomyces chumphonensis TaxID=1214925 RepID=UPI003D70B11D
MVTIIDRSVWKAEPGRPVEGNWDPQKGGVVIHHMGGGSHPPDSGLHCYGMVKDIQSKHMDPGLRGWLPDWAPGYLETYDDIAYNFVVCQHGDIFEGRGLHVRPAANGTRSIVVSRAESVGANEGFYAILGLLGEEDQPSASMRASIKDLIEYLREHRTYPAGLMIRGHQDVFDTQCPGNLQPYVDNGSLEPPAPPPATSVTIISRSRWGARPPVAHERTTWSARTGFTVHYSAGPTTQTPRQIQNYHMDANGWSDIGYNFLVDAGGRAYEGRGWLTVGAHASGHNTSHVGVCFIGRDGDATAAAKSTIRALYRKANELSGKTLTPTYHGGLPGNSTSCPGADLRTWVQNGMDADDIPIGDDSPPPSDGGGGGGMTSVRSVSAQQRAVNALGYSPALDVDGIWGPRTDAGVRWLQGRVGVTADGLWGPATEAAYTAYVGGGTSGGGMTSVRSVISQQSAVNSLGYAPPLDVDGVWGPRTDAGVRWLQGRVGVTVDGLWGPATERAYYSFVDGGAWLTVDGDFGPATVSATQRAIGTPADGVWGPASRRALQRHLNRWAHADLVVDGDFGPASVRALQRHLNRMGGAGLDVDGAWGTSTTTALQRTLNRGRF